MSNVKTLAIAIALTFFGASNAFACFLSGEQTSGMNKICYYNCISGTKAITISSLALCPLNISYEIDKKEKEQNFLRQANNVCVSNEERLQTMICNKTAS